MERIKIFQFLLLIIFYNILNNSYSQQGNISKTVNEYWETVDNYLLRYNSKNDFTKNYSSSEIDTLTKKYYMAMGDDPIGYYIKLGVENAKWDSIASKNHRLPVELKPATKLFLMKKIISKKYGDSFTEIISTPYYLRVKIIGDSGSIYVGLINSKIKNNPDNIFRTSQGNLIAVVEDIVKGDKFFKVGETITISFLTFWIADGGMFFEKGKTYFIPLRPWDSDNNYSKLTISILPDKNYAIYPIENGVVSTPRNYFKINDKTNWEDFKQAFQKNYILN